ncbi:MAG: 50S ribosomal protein L13 [Candidatus Gottesmanbacteria bacterium GW2011_GWA1_34_13]|uniref:Large ribosomal subunit protein uL13 n=1 Tax=Candidatus Gottesmanbacteria bacterium GW2011_GWA1_34_13 TaxID=1618434 RepID=A0A0G0AS21_9BACT|nr:MAG: 50S ribosomal protein L13 [Candidatus Gottesmanbacteria bacterium GW2011_GWA1_34_13]
MNFTKATKQEQIEHKWHLVDVKDKILGRIATDIALKLMGKNKLYFVRNMDCGDYVVVINIKDIKVTGKKLTQKIYTNYSGYPAGLRSEALKDLLNRKPEEVMYRAVAGMLPKNKLRNDLLKRLYLFAGAEHKYQEKFDNKKQK